MMMTGDGTVGIRLGVNGAEIEALIDVRTSLLDLIRDDLGLTGTKKGCDQGACGACTLLVDGARIVSCLALAVQCDGRAVTTIEGVGQQGGLHPLQEAFITHDGYQCGYCTPGQICSAIGMINELARGVPSYASGDLSVDVASVTAADIRERMSGNLCRCGAYEGIVEAIRATLSDVADCGAP